MNTSLQNLIDRQRQRMRELREDARDLANTVAREVWNRFKDEVEETTADGYMFDMAEITQMALTSSLALNYDEVFERHVLSLFERLEQELREAGVSEATLNVAGLDLSGLRSGLKLRSHAEELIGQAIRRAKPGLIGMLFRSSAPASDSWDRELRENASRLRSNLLGLQEQIVEAIRDETLAVIQSARLAYSDMLDGLHPSA